MQPKRIAALRFGAQEATADAFCEWHQVAEVFLAAGILRLVEEGLSDLDANVVEVLPNTDLSEFCNDITLRHLLNHTSGITKAQGFDALPTLVLGFLQVD